MRRLAIPIASALGAAAAFGLTRVPSDYRRRARIAWHALRGKPVIAGVSLVAPPLLKLAGDQQGVLVEGCHFDGRTAIGIEGGKP